MQSSRVGSGVAVLDAAVRVHQGDGLGQGVERGQAEGCLLCQLDGAGSQACRAHDFGNEMQCETTLIVTEPGSVRGTHEAYILLHAALDAKHQAHGVLHAHGSEAIGIKGTARHVAFAEVLMVQQHFALTQS